MNKPAEGTEPSVVQLQETELNAKDSMSNTESASYFGPWMIVEQKVRKSRGAQDRGIGKEGRGQIVTKQGPHPIL